MKFIISFSLEIYINFDNIVNFIEATVAHTWQSNTRIMRTRTRDLIDLQVFAPSSTSHQSKPLTVGKTCNQSSAEQEVTIKRLRSGFVNSSDSELDQLNKTVEENNSKIQELIKSEK